MKITFSLLKAPAKAALQQGQKTFDALGGSIGRAEGNQWVLPDPDKFLSSKHCLISCEQQQFYVTDTSTNGLFLNGASLPIGRNNKVVISEGDTLDLGEYRLRVSIDKGAAGVSPFAQMAPVAPDPGFAGGSEWGSLEDERPAGGSFPADPLASPLAPADPKGFGAADHPFAAPQDPFRADPFAPAGPASLGDPFAGQGFAPGADPFAGAGAAFPGSESPFPGAESAFPGAGTDPFAVDPFAKGNPFESAVPPAAPRFTQGDIGSPLSEAMQLPPVAQTGGIPDDFWSSLGGADEAAKALGMPRPSLDDPFKQSDPFAPAPVDPFAGQPTYPVAPPPATPPVRTPPLAPPPAVPEPFSPQPTALERPLDPHEHLYPVPGHTVPPQPSDGRVPLAERLKTLVPTEWQDPPAALSVTPVAPMAPVNPVAPLVPPVAVPPVAPPAASAGATQQTAELLAALGLSGKLTQAQEALMPQLIGEITRESLNGLLQILRARNAIKNEFRITVTTIQATENNPVKFATDVDDALDLLFVRQSKGYKPPLESVRDSFESIMDHQVAVLAGIRAAFGALLNRFDPVQLENQFERLGKTGGILPGMKGAKCWSAYDEFYQELKGNFENSFQNLFGDDFVQAYEEQLRKLSIARKLDNK